MCTLSNQNVSCYRDKTLSYSISLQNDHNNSHVCQDEQHILKPDNVLTYLPL